MIRFGQASEEHDEGFTLIELLVVIIIIGILAAIAIPVFLSQKSKGYEASMKSDLRTVAEEVESYNVDNGNYATTPFKVANTGPVAGSTTISGSGQVVGANTAINLSAGNSILWVGSSATSYCLKATSTKASSATWYYTSTGGGITKTACTS